MIGNFHVLRAACALMILAATASAADAARRGSTNLDWRRVATTEDRQRIRDWREAFTKGLAAAQAGGYGDQVAAEGVLLKPDAARGNPELPPGNYRCRIIKLGANGSATNPYTVFPPFTCRIGTDGPLGSLRRTTGAQRPSGLIFDDGSARLIFLGTMVLGDERRPLDYGIDADRDMAGVIERIGDKRWRLLLPYPKFESLIDVVEMVPTDEK
jgi:hypothetical protein